MCILKIQNAKKNKKNKKISNFFNRILDFKNTHIWSKNDFKHHFKRPFCSKLKCNASKLEIWKKTHFLRETVHNSAPPTFDFF